MKILITHEVFPPEATSGGEKLTFKLAELLKKRNHDVEIFTSGNPKIKKFKNIKTKRIAINRYLSVFSLPFLIKEAKKYDLIHTSTGNMAIPSFIAAKVLRKPIVLYVHHILGKEWKRVRGRFLGRLFEFIEKIIFNLDFDKIIFQNKNSADIARKMGMKKEKIDFAYPGINWEDYNVNMERKDRVLFVGNYSMNEEMIKTKGLDYLVSVAKKMKDMKFVIVGGGKGLEHLKENSPSNVKIAGPLNKENLIKEYNKSSIFCLPSLNEGFGFTILEAMASGCAIISTIDIGQRGVLIDPKDENELKNAINHLMGNPRKRKNIGKKNKLLAKKYTWEKFIKKMTETYRSLF